MVLGLTYNFLPFLVLPLYASLERLDTRLLEAAGDLYASPARTFVKVTLPLSMPGLVAGTLLFFIPAVGDYINAALLGNTNTAMVGNVVELGVPVPPGTTAGRRALVPADGARSW